MKKILVTGAGGYMGRHIVTKLLDKGADVVAVDFYTDGIDDRATKLSVDIFSGDKDLYEKLGSPDVVLHLAWKDGFVHNSNAHIEMLSSHFVFLKYMAECGVKQIAVMGTMHEVGYHEGEINDDTPCNPKSMYGIAKDTLRKSLFSIFTDSDVKLQWLRAFYIYGDDKRSNSIFAKLMQAADDGKETFPFTSGKNKYDFISVAELADQISSCVLQDEVYGIINCCSGKPISLAEMVETFIKDNNLNIKLEYGAFPDRPYDSPAIWGNADKIQSIMSKM